MKSLSLKKIASSKGKSSRTNLNKIFFKGKFFVIIIIVFFLTFIFGGTFLSVLTNSRSKSEVTIDYSSISNYLEELTKILGFENVFVSNCTDLMQDHFKGKISRIEFLSDFHSCIVLTDKTLNSLTSLIPPNEMEQYHDYMILAEKHRLTFFLDTSLFVFTGNFSYSQSATENAENSSYYLALSTRELEKLTKEIKK